MLPIWYSSSELNAPTLNNAAGSLIAVLDACLVNGFGLKSVTSITLSGTLATVTCNGHQFSGGVGKRVLIAGSSVTAINAAHEVTVVDANTFTFPTTATGTVSGTLTAKRAPLGWTKPYSGTNTAMYARTDGAATGMLLRVVDTATTPATTSYARAFGVESASDIGTYDGQFPTPAQFADGVYVSKGTSNTTAKQWHLVGDGRTLHLFTDDGAFPYYSGYFGLHYFTFGDIDSWRSGGDSHSCLIGGGVDTNGGNYSHQSLLPTSSTGVYLARPNNLIGSAVKASHWGRGVTAPGYASDSGGIYPSPVDNGMALERTVLVREESAAFLHPFRGRARGVAHPMAYLNSSDASASSFHGSTKSGWIGTTDTFVSFVALNNSSRSFLFFNLTSEW